ncbi:MAG: AMP-binding protein [Pseudomonadales bacterium]|nr:AMP-binding protein [Pseudomonadales bacterium]
MGQNYPLPPQMLDKWARETPDKVYLRQPVNRVYREFTWSQVRDQVLRMANALKKLGLKPGDKVAIMSKNCAEWFIADFAITAAGMISAPIYFTASSKTIRFIIEHSEAKAVFIGKLDDTKPTIEGIPESTIKIAMPYDTAPCDHSWDDLLKNNDPVEKSAQPELDDTFSLSYTSGSTGNPKAAVLTFRNVAYGAITPANELQVTQSDRLISYLPLAHITERALIEHMSLYSGATVTFVESLDTFAEDLRSANPSLFISVPRLWMKFQAGILAKLPQKKLDKLLKLPIIGSLVRNKVKKQLGLSNARLCGSGTAPISPAILEWYRKIGINISEGWGMTETTGLAVMQYPFRTEKLGTIGQAVNGTEIKISDAGEILVRGDGVVNGYYKDDEKTAETFVDGWLHTGDKAEMDADGCLRITGRVKDIFKSGKGKYVVPVPIESLLYENNMIEQMCVMGSGLPQPVAVVVLSEETTQGLSQEEIQSSLSDTLNSVNKRLEGHEKLDRIFVAKDPWTIENGLLTPTMKIKRNDLESLYAQAIAVESRDKVVWQ